MRKDDPKWMTYLAWLKTLPSPAKAEAERKRAAYAQARREEWTVHPPVDTFAHTITRLYLESIERDWAKGWKAF